MPRAPEHLLALALSRPQEALATARAVLDAQPTPFEASIARQAAGIVLRDLGDVPAAIHEFRVALRMARITGRTDREVDILASLGVALAMSGRTAQGLAALDRAVDHARGALAGRVLMRRGGLLSVLGRHQEALDDLRGAVSRLRRAGETVWEARSLTHQALAYLAVGDTRRADSDFARAEELFAAGGQEYEYAVARHNRGLAAFARGDLPAALAYLDEAGQRYEALAAPMPDLAIDRCAVLLAAGLTRDAFAETEVAAKLMEKEGGQATKRAEVFFAAATAALAAAEVPTARERALQALRLFRTQKRDWWAARAELVVVQAGHAEGDVSGRLLRQAEQVAERLERLRIGEAPRAYLLAGRLALGLGRRAEAERHLERAARSRHRGPPLTRSTGWLAQAILSEARGRPRATVAACTRGLDTLDEHRLVLGATELRAHATAHGAELAMIAQRDAVRRGDARRLLAWSERWRATTLAAPPVRPPDDRELVAELAALREVESRLQGVRGVRGATTIALERERRRLEEAVRARSLRTRGAALAATAPVGSDGAGGRSADGAEADRFDLAWLFAGLDGMRLVELVEVDGTLHALVVAGRRVRRHVVGTAERADHAVEICRWALRRAAYDRPSRHAGPDLHEAGRLAEQTLLGPAARDLGDEPLVVVPPGRLHAVPWGLLPSLRYRVVSVAPSASTWLRARRTRPPARHRVALVVGPGLDTGGAEVPELAERYPGATVLGHGSATAERVLAALDGAWLAHVAAHGTFRADSPLFSSLRLDDGPLTVHDFERLRRAPYRLVLSSCESGVARPVGADELLGLVSGLVPLGAAGILASVVPVNDAASVPLMLALHRQLRSGGTLAEALVAARAEAGDDPVTVATGSSYVALGL